MKIMQTKFFNLRIYFTIEKLTTFQYVRTGCDFAIILNKTRLGAKILKYGEPHHAMRSIDK